MFVKPSAGRSMFAKQLIFAEQSTSIKKKFLEADFC